jgi:HEAT repeat protein
MAVSEKLRALVDQMPAADSRGMYTGEMNKDHIEKTATLIYEGGAENMAGLVEMLGEPGSEEDVKPHYAMHCVINHALVIKDEKGRKELCEILAAKLSSDLSNYNKAYLCQELQWAGGSESVAALGKLLLDEELVEPASMALVAIEDGAVDPFQAALPKAKGKCRLSVIQGLGALKVAKSIDALTEALSDSDREVRIAAGWGLANLGDPSSVDPLIKAADTDPGWERIQAAKHCVELAEKLMAAGKKEPAVKIYEYLYKSRTDASEKYIRDLAQQALGSV